MDEIDVAVIGAGVVGLAIARKLAVAGREVVLIESEALIGSGVSSRNSEVIHAGIYYAPGSLKATLCVAGKKMLYDYCRARHVAHRRLGKLLVASGTGCFDRLEAIRRNAIASDVLDLELLTSQGIASLEPSVRADAALFSPSSGIIDSHGLMTALLADAEANGAALALKSRVARGRCTSDGIVLEIASDGLSEIRCKSVINAAGLGAIGVAKSLDGFPHHLVPEQHLAKGNYFALMGRAPFSHLIYPLPEIGGLGIHVTLDMAGQVKFGPDVQWIDSLDFTVSNSRLPAFERAIRSYWPDLPEASLAPAYAGVRPKLKVQEGTADFLIQTQAEHGIAGLVHLFGIESPGLTACLAIADYVARSLGCAV
jgi:L-2-hydroxyglutarate oxidase LhgO